MPLVLQCVCGRCCFEWLRILDSTISRLLSRLSSHHLHAPHTIRQVANDEKFRPPIPDGFPSALTHLMQDCWQANPHDRPTFREILSRLSRFSNTYNPSAHAAYSTFLTSVNAMATSIGLT